MSDMAQPLGQQQLVESAPSRRIIVPKGHGWWWGVDPSTRGVSIAYVNAKGRRGVRTMPFAAGEGPARLAQILSLTRSNTGWLCLRGFNPGIVLIEQPSGKQDNPTLLYAVGVIQGAIAAALAEVYGREIRCEAVTSAHWKKVACGRGNIYKPKRRGDPYGVLTWAQANGYRGSSWDEADALGVAECARREIGLEER